MLWPGCVGDLPPLSNAAVCMARCGAAVRVAAAGCSEATNVFLREKKVEVVSLGIERIPLDLGSRLGVIVRAGGLFRRCKREWQPDVLWFHGGHAMRYAPLLHGGRRVLVVAHAHELYPEGSELDWWQTRRCRTADAVLCPEANRIWILQLRSRSGAKFFLVPNDTPPDPPAGPCDCGYALDLFRHNGGAAECDELLIYQGRFSPDRCITEIISAFKRLRRPRAGLILLGGGMDRAYSARIGALARGDQRIVVVPRIEPPGHLRVTCGCVGGILLYAPTDLNNIYCAPNKVFEYARAGIPMIFPSYPGLAALNDAYQLGHQCDPTDPRSILSAMERLFAHRGDWTGEGPRRFLNSVTPISERYGKIMEFLSQAGGPAA